MKFSWALIAALSLAACGDGGDDDLGATTGSNDAGITACGTDTYANYGQKFFTDNCTTCHGAQAALLGDNVKLDTLAGIKEHKPHIIEHAVELKEPIMPSGGKGLPAAERERLKKWLNCGPN
jgi:cytochrome c5